jgi:hypothetical protein
MSEVKVETDLTGIQKPEKKMFRERFETYLAGLVAGSAENDPAAVTTYSVAGFFWYKPPKEGKKKYGSRRGIENCSNKLIYF